MNTIHMHGNAFTRAIRRFFNLPVKFTSTDVHLGVRYSMTALTYRDGTVKVIDERVDGEPFTYWTDELATPEVYEKIYDKWKPKDTP